MNEPVHPLNDLGTQFNDMKKLVDDWKRNTDRMIAILACLALGFAALFFASVGGHLR